MAAKTSDNNNNKESIDFASFINNNIDFDFNGKPYIIFDEPKYFYKFFIPKSLPNIKEDAYNQIMSSLSTFIILNPKEEQSVYMSVIRILNSKAYNILTSSDLKEMVEDLMYLNSVNELEETEISTISEPEIKQKIVLTTPTLKRNFVLNPALSESEKAKYKSICTGLVRKRSTLNSLISVLLNWSSNYGKPTNEKISKLSGLSIRTIEEYSPLLKEEKKVALKACPKTNKTLAKLKAILHTWDISQGKPTNEKISKLSKLSVDSVKRYSPLLKKAKSRIANKIKNYDKEYPFFAPFDSKDYTIEEPKIKKEISYWHDAPHNPAIEIIRDIHYQKELLKIQDRIRTNF